MMSITASYNNDSDYKQIQIFAIINILLPLLLHLREYQTLVS